MNHHKEVEQHILKVFEVQKLLGSGAYGHVWHVKDRVSGQSYALKKICGAFRNAIDAQRTYREMMILSECNHPNIVKLVQVIRSTNNLDLYLLMEYTEIDLHQLLRLKVLKPMQKRKIVYQLLQAVRYLHQCQIIHRDLKPTNILVNNKCEVKLCDFGLARTISQMFGSDSQQEIMTDNVATRWYCAPEILLSDVYNKQVDVWSLGCVIAEMILGRPLLYSSSNYQQLERIIEFTGMPSSDDINHLQSQAAQQLICKFKHIRQKRRLNQWYSDLTPLVIEMLQFNPHKRLTFEQALKNPLFLNYGGIGIEALSDLPIVTKLDDDRCFSIQRYRSAIYDEIRRKYNDLQHQTKSWYEKRRSSDIVNRNNRLTCYEKNQPKLTKTCSVGSAFCTPYEESATLSKESAKRKVSIKKFFRETSTVQLIDRLLHKKSLNKMTCKPTLEKKTSKGPTRKVGNLLDKQRKRSATFLPK